MNYLTEPTKKTRKPYSQVVAEGKNFKAPQDFFQWSGLIWVSALTLILFTLLAAWLIIDKIKIQTQKDIGITLDTVLKTTQEALNNWGLRQKTEVTTWSSSPQLIKLAEAQLNRQHDRETLLASPALAGLRELLQPPMGKNNFIGFFVISPDYINVASMRNANVGITNLLTTQKGFLQKVLDGNVLLSPILHSDVPLRDARNHLVERQSTMFVAAPIKKDNETIGILTFRIDPGQHLSRITQLGRVGKTGETYAFDKTGRLVSESRFDEDLRNIGLIPFAKRGILNIEIRDPGGNLMEGFKPAVSRHKLPLTYMASEAIAKRPGLNLDGYSDYRGVPVAGAWLWNEEMGFGLATEIQYAEAFGIYNTIRWSIILALSLTGILSLGLTINLERGRRKALNLAQKIQEGEIHLKAILENILEGIITIDENGTVQTLNQATEQIFFYQASELIGQNINTLMPEPYQSNHESYLQNYLRTGETKILGGQRELVGRRKDGSIFPLDLSLSEMWQGKKRIFVGAVRDISARKLSEEKLAQRTTELERSNTELEKFAYVVSHDLKAPLRGIGSLSDIIVSDYAERLDGQGKELLTMLGKRVKRMDAFINGLLDYSRIGRTQTDKENMDMNTIVSNVLENLDLPHNVDVEIKNKLPWVFGEKIRVYQVIQNLLTNAINCIDKSQGKITIHFSDIGDYVKFFIKDNGIGIEKKHFEKIFQMFQTLAPRDKVERTGIGLALVKKIIDKHGGEIGVESVLGKGSTFYFTLPKGQKNKIAHENEL